MFLCFVVLHTELILLQAAYKQYEKDLIQGAGGSVAVESREVKFAPYWEDQKEFSRPDPDDEDGETSHVEHDGDERPEDKMGVIGEWVRVEHQGERPFSGAALNTGGSKLFKKVRGTRRAREDTEVLEFKPEQKIAFTYSDLDSKNLEDFIDEGLGRNDPDCCDPDTAEALPLFKKRNRKSPKNLRTR